MTQAYWCIFIAILIPYIVVFFAKLGAPGYNNATPRSMMPTLGGWRIRAYWSHQNSLEAIPAFIAAIIIAQINNVDQNTINLFAKSFIGFRLAYVILYINDNYIWRSLAWFGGFLCVISIFLVTAKILVI